MKSVAMREISNARVAVEFQAYIYFLSRVKNGY